MKMKKYIEPEFIISEFEMVDVLSSSTPDIPGDDNDVVWEED